jgi:aromatic ring-opening dioxygenase catalytic subunit (LigB family)
MSKIMAGLASSHAYALQEPVVWDAMRSRTMERFKQRYGSYPPMHPQVMAETLERREEKYKKIREGLNFLRQKLSKRKPDALVLIGDDQDENFTEDNLSQISLYVGEEFTLRKPAKNGGAAADVRYPSHSRLASHLLHGLIREEFDVGYSKRFPGDLLRSHAHWQILDRMVPGADVPVVLLFINAIHVPAISPGRCYRLGQAIGRLVTEHSGEESVAIYGSGGLSHFTSGYPWSYYSGNFTLGSISEDFDRYATGLLAEGKGEELAAATSEEFLAHGEIELRSWLVVAGALEPVRPQLLVYEPFYSGVMGMGVAYWES